MFDKLLLASTAVAFTMAQPGVWPPDRSMTGLVCGFGAVATNPTGDCCPVKGMNRQMCSRLSAAWISSKCAPAGSLTNPQTNVNYIQRAVSWIGPGTPKPCFNKAKKLRKNPARYCKDVNQDTHWGDGGCRLFDECPIIMSEDVCEKHPWCEWKSQTCQYRNGYTIQTAPRSG